MEQLPPPGTVVLRPHRWTPWAILVVPVVFGVVGVQLWRHRDTTGLPTTATYVAVALCAVLVLLGLLALRRAPRLSFHVTAYDVAVLLGSRERCRLRYQDLSEVRLTISGFRRTTAAAVNSFSLTGTTPAGELRKIRIALSLVPTLQPLVDALAPVVAARPELLRDEQSRALFASREQAR